MAFNEFQNWREEKKRAKAGEYFIKNLSEPKILSDKTIRNIIVWYGFLISVASSGILELTSIQTTSVLKTNLYAMFIYYGSSIIPSVLIRYVIKDNSYSSIVFISMFVLVVGCVWGAMTALLHSSLGVSWLYSGIFTGVMIAIINITMPVKD